jgi:glycosyltransferase involved in cell wall biosynthesis
MRILRISGGLDPAFGGPTNSTARAAAADSRAGHSVVLAFAGTPGAHRESADLLGWLASEGVELRSFHTAPALGRLGHRFAVSPRMLIWLLRGVKGADVVHVHGAWPVTSFAGLLLARLYRIPTVLTPHESLTTADVVTSKTHAREATKRALRRIWLSAASAVVFSSELEMEESLDKQTKARTTVVPHPVVDERKPASVGRRVARPADSGLRLGFLGRFHEKKNLPMLVEAVAALPKEVTLTISGGGYGSEKELRYLAVGLGLGDRVSWMGFTHHDERDRFWDQVDVLVLPSRFECFGMVVVEAMERGVPTIVAARVGAATLVSRHNAGLVIDPSVQGITQAVLDLLHDPDRRAVCSAGGRRGALADLTLERYGESMAGIYRSLIEG